MRVVCTGGLGFIGSNLVSRLAAAGHRVWAFDNLSRDFVERRVAEFGRQPAITLVRGDVRFESDLAALPARVDAVVHLAGNSGIPWSVADPLKDFYENVVGTLNALRYAQRAEAGLVMGSTNRVYPSTVGQPLREGPLRYESDWLGVAEDCGLAGQRSPYGVSKLAADVYCQEWMHTYGVPTVVNRMGVVYGPRQYGATEQGWVGYFCRMAHTGQPITIYGNGKQVRDPLYIDDLLALYLLEVERLGEFAGEVFNVGGGPANAVSLLQAVDRIGVRVEAFEPERPADIRWYITDHRKVTRATGWRPRVSFAEGVSATLDWLGQELDLD